MFIMIKDSFMLQNDQLDVGLHVQNASSGVDQSDTNFVFSNFENELYVALQF